MSKVWVMTNETEEYSWSDDMDWNYKLDANSIGQIIVRRHPLGRENDSTPVMVFAAGRWIMAGVE